MSAIPKLEPVDEAYLRRYAAELDGGSRVYEDSERGPADPVKDAETLNAIKDYILRRYKKTGRRNWMIFLFGTYTGRRCGDVLKLKVGTLLDEQGRVRSAVQYTEQKTSRRKKGEENATPNNRIMNLNDVLRRELENYISEAGLKSEDYLFPSRKKAGNRQRFKPIHRKDGSVVYRDVTLPDGMMEVDTFGKILRDVRRDLELNFRLSTHSMRKTCGYNIFKQTRSLEFTRDALGHSSIEVTKRYIGTYDEHVAEIFDSLVIPGLNDD